MALSRSGFRALYPEFDKVGDGVVDAKLVEAEARLDTTFWGDRFDLAHGLLTSHLIAISPSGRHARLDPKKASGFTSTYEREFDKLLRENYQGPLVSSETA